MFTNQEEENQALNELNASIQRFNKNYSVTADVGILSAASNKKSANRIFIAAFNALLREALQNEESNKNINVASMRIAFERDVVEPYRSFSIRKAMPNEVERVKKKQPDVNAGLNSDEWAQQYNKTLDSIYWEKIDTVANNYKNGSPRIRDMVRETKRILNTQGNISSEDVKTVASYAAALKRANESRSGIWKFFNYFRSNAEQRESANIERMLNERLGDPNACRNAIKDIADPTGVIERLIDRTKANKSIKLDLSAASNEKTKAEKLEKREESPIKEEKEQIRIDDQQISQEFKGKEKVPGNERLYSLIGDKSFKAKLKNEIWAALKLKETFKLDKETVSNQIYEGLLDSAESVNKDYKDILDTGADDDKIHETFDYGATSMFTMAFFSLNDLPLGPEDRMIAAQKIANTMLNKLTVVGFEKDKFGKYGDSYAVKNETAALEVLQEGKDALPPDTSKRLVRSAKKILSTAEKEKVDFSLLNNPKKDVPVSAKNEERSIRDTILKK